MEKIIKSIDVNAHTNLTEKIREKLEEMYNNPLQLRKKFIFSSEEIQDFPELCFSKIENYLQLHKDNRNK